MAKVLIVYGTTSGNTEWVVTNVAKSLTASGHEVTTERCEMSEPSSIPNYDVVLLACPTYNVGKLQENFDEYYKKFITNKFDGKKF
jgi:flavodoxin